MGKSNETLDVNSRASLNRPSHRLSRQSEAPGDNIDEFKKMDANTDGKVTPEEFKRRKTGYVTRNITGGLNLGHCTETDPYRH